jgi:hypothetical protein
MAGFLTRNQTQKKALVAKVNNSRERKKDDDEE